MINNLFPTPIYSNTIDSDTLKKLQTDINDYIKNNRSEFNLKLDSNTETNILRRREIFFSKYLKDLIIQNSILLFSTGLNFTFFYGGCWQLWVERTFQDLMTFNSTTQRDVFS